MAQYWGNWVWGCRVRRAQPELTWPRIRLPLVFPQGSQDKALTPEHSLQAILALILSYLSLSLLCLLLQEGRTYACFLYCTISVRSITPRTRWASNSICLNNKCYLSDSGDCVPGTLSPLSSPALPPTMALHPGTLSVQGRAGLRGPAHLSAGHSCPVAPGRAVVAVSGLHADLGLPVACDLGRGLVHAESLFLQGRGKSLATQSQDGLGVFLQSFISPNKYT